MPISIYDYGGGFQAFDFGQYVGHPKRGRLSYCCAYLSGAAAAGLTGPNAAADLLDRIVRELLSNESIRFEMNHVLETLGDDIGHEVKSIEQYAYWIQRGGVQVGDLIFSAMHVTLNREVIVLRKNGSISYQSPPGSAGPPIVIGRTEKEDHYVCLVRSENVALISQITGSPLPQLPEVMITETKKKRKKSRKNKVEAKAMQDSSNSSIDVDDMEEDQVKVVESEAFAVSAKPLLNPGFAANACDDDAFAVKETKKRSRASARYKDSEEDSEEDEEECGPEAIDDSQGNAGRSELVKLAKIAADAVEKLRVSALALSSSSSSSSSPALVTRTTARLSTSSLTSSSSLLSSPSTSSSSSSPFSQASLRATGPKTLAQLQALAGAKDPNYLETCAGNEVFTANAAKAIAASNQDTLDRAEAVRGFLPPPRTCCTRLDRSSLTHHQKASR